MRVPVEMPEEVWGRLASIADNRGVRVADLIADAVEDVLKSAPRLLPTPGRDAEGKPISALGMQVWALKRAGKSWRAIGRELGLHPSTVRYAAGVKK